MPRYLANNGRGRRHSAAGHRTPRSQKNKDNTYQEKLQQKRKGGGKYRVTTPTKARRRQAVTQKLTDNESTTSGAESADEGAQEDDEDDDDDDDEDEDEDEPAVIAPSHTINLHETGRYRYDRSDDNLSEADETESLFGGSYSAEKDEELQNRLMDDNDDAYLGVDDISDSDIDDERLMAEEAKNFLIDMADEELRDDSEDPSFYLNQIEGMSAYGFGDESDESDKSEGTIKFLGSSQNSESGMEAVARRVHFEELPQDHEVFRGFSESPTMTRALLPSALPNTLVHSSNDTSIEQENYDSEETDSDRTDDDLPDIALRTPQNNDDREEYPPLDNSPSKKMRPPPVGKFIDDGSQSAGILDSTGTMLLITNPQNLGEEFSRRYGTSAPSSPGPDYAAAILGSAGNTPEQSNILVPDPMVSGLTSRDNATANGHTVGIPGAFFAPSEDVATIMGTFSTHVEEEGSVCSDLDEGEQAIRIEDIVAFDSDSDGDLSMLPSVTLDSFSSPGLSYLNNGNLTAFRRNADPTFHALHSSPMSHYVTSQATHVAKASPLRKIRHHRKRKSMNDSPYSDVYYKGVTPVQRISHPDNDQSASSPAPAKRRRMT